MYVRVRVTPGAKKELVKQVDETTFNIMIKEPAQRNAANKRVREIVAREWGVSVGSVQLVSGHRSPQKIMSVDI